MMIDVFGVNFFVGFVGFQFVDMMDWMWDMIWMLLFGGMVLFLGVMYGLLLLLLSMFDMMLLFMNVEEFDKWIIDLCVVE